VVQVKFEQSFKLVEEDETASLKPLFLDTMKQVTTLENDSDGIDDPFENVVVERPPLAKHDSILTNLVEQ
jgi:hypothetical protein